MQSTGPDKTHKVGILSLAAEIQTLTYLFCSVKLKVNYLFPKCVPPPKGKVMVQVEVHSLISSTKCYSPDFPQLPPGRVQGPVHSEAVSNRPGSMQPICHFQCTKLFKHANLHCPIPGTHLLLGWESGHAGRVLAYRSTTAKYFQPSRGSNPWYLACKSRTLPLIEPQCLTHLERFQLLQKM